MLTTSAGHIIDKKEGCPKKEREEKKMIELNMSDVISVLESCRQYLIALAVILTVGILLMAAGMKLPEIKKKLVRREAVIAMALGVCVVVNLICFGPMNTLLSLATGGSGTITEETTAQSNEDCRQVAREGIVLLENDGLLPLEEKSCINVFGWRVQIRSTEVRERAL